MENQLCAVNFCRYLVNHPKSSSEVTVATSIKLVAGKVTVSAKYNNHVRVLPLLIAEGDAPLLLGRNWIEALNIPVFTVAVMSNN